MPITITTSPAYPVEGEEVTITVSGASGTVHGLELTARPSASAVELGVVTSGLATSRLDDEGYSVGQYATISGFAAEIPNQTGDSSMEQPGGSLGNAVTFDKAGEYNLTVYDYRYVSGVASFPGDPQGESRHQLVATAAVSVHVGAYSYLDIKTAEGRGGRLRLQVNNATVRDADITDTTDEQARQAALQPTVTAALAALVGQTVASIGTDLQTGVSLLRTKYEAHRVQVATPDSHLVADNTNTIDRTAATSNDGAISLLNELLEVMIHHFQDASDAPSPWHTEDDLESTPVAGSATTVAQATVLSADLRERCYERHRLLDGDVGEPTVHGADDTVNALSDPSKLDDVIVAYLDALVSNNPTAASNESEGLTDLRHMYGFEP